jgi:hypothetical protein
MADAIEKPQCGGGEEEGEYDLPLHVAAVCQYNTFRNLAPLTGSVIVLAASILGCGFPVVAKKVKSLHIPPKVFFFCKHFGTGVLIATAFVHV